MIHLRQNSDVGRPFQMSSDSGSGSEDDGPEPGLALERALRSNAGSKMAKLLTQEEEDDFYKTTYGGFNVSIHGLFLSMIIRVRPPSQS